LYDPSQHLVNPENARSILATAFFFQGMPELVHHAYTVCRDSLSSERIIGYVHWLGASSPKQVYGNRDSGMSFGTVMVQDGRATPVPSETTEWVEDGFARYGEWSVRLKQDV